MINAESPPKWEERHHEIKEILLGILSDESDVGESISFILNKNGDIAIRMFDTLAIYIYAGKKVARFSIRQEYYDKIEVLIKTEPEKLRAGWAITHLESIQSLYFYSALIQGIYGYEDLRSHGDLFSCCSRYEACSDALECVSPYPELKRACSYRNKLLKGTVFYGKKRNV